MQICSKLPTPEHLFEGINARHRCPNDLPHHAPSFSPLPGKFEQRCGSLPEHPLFVVVTAALEVLHGPGERMVVALTTGYWREITAPHHPSCPEGVVRHLDKWWHVRKAHRLRERDGTRAN